MFLNYAPWRQTPELTATDSLTQFEKSSNSFGDCRE